MPKEREEALTKDKKRIRKITIITTIATTLVTFLIAFLMIKIDIKNPILNWLPGALFPLTIIPIFWIFCLANLRKKDGFENLSNWDLVVFFPNYKNWLVKNSGS